VKARKVEVLPGQQGLFGDLPVPISTRGFSPREIIELIRRRRLQCLVHRYLYYVLGETLITDAKYDQFERDLKALVARHPELERKVCWDFLCPSRNVGSSNPEDYPRQIEQIALSLLAYQKEAKR
jgi:NAD-dependent DNA ligase